VADYRQTHRFLTLDYSDGSPPRRYVGKAVTWPTSSASCCASPTRSPAAPAT
jgi:hypothetical protein